MDDQPGRKVRDAVAWSVGVVLVVVGAILMWGYELFTGVEASDPGSQAANKIVVVSGFVCAVVAIVVVMFGPSDQSTPAPGPDGSDLDDPDLDDPDLLRPSTPVWRRRTATEMLVSGVVGIYAAFVLSIDAWLLAKNPDRVFGCDISTAISCGDVARSWQANLLTFPNAFLGILFESVVLTVSTALVAGVVFPRWFMRGVQALYTVALLFAVWLFTQSYFVIHALCPWCLLITFTTILVWAGLTRINIRDGHLPTSPGVRRLVVTTAYWYLAVAVCAVIVAMILGKYGTTLLADPPPPPGQQVVHTESG